MPIVRNYKRIKGKSLDQKLKSIDNILDWAMPRLRTKVVGVIPPIPVDVFCEKLDESGIVLRKLFVIPGRITKGILRVEQMPKERPTLTVQIEDDAGGSHVDLEIRQTMSITPNLDVLPGQRLTVSINPPVDVGMVWAGFLLEPDVRLMQRKETLLEELVPMLKAEEDEYAEEVGKEVTEES